MKSKTTAAMLALFLGGIGIHKFYLNQSGLGVVYLLFCWTLIPGIIAFIEFIILLTMDENQFNQKYNSTYRVPYPNYTNIPVNNGIQNQAHSTRSAIDEIEKLHNLKEKGIITQEEFESKKRMLL